MKEHMKGVDYNEFDDLTCKRLRHLRIISVSAFASLFIVMGYFSAYPLPSSGIVFILLITLVSAVEAIMKRQFNGIVRDQRDRYERSQTLRDRITRAKHNIVISGLMLICEIGIASYLVTHYNFNLSNLSFYSRLGIAAFVTSPFQMYSTVQQVRKYIVLRRERAS